MAALSVPGASSSIIVKHMLLEQTLLMLCGADASDGEGEVGAGIHTATETCMFHTPSQALWQPSGARSVFGGQVVALCLVSYSLLELFPCIPLSTRLSAASCLSDCGARLGAPQSAQLFPGTNQRLRKRKL
jgi:hypothetical protein